MSKSIKDLKGQRLLFRTQQGSGVQEGVVMEFSPSGNHVKVGNAWHATDHVNVVEVLPTVKAPKVEKVAESAAADSAKTPPSNPAPKQ